VIISGSRRCPVPRKWNPPRVLEVRRGSPCSGHVEEGDLLLEIDGRPPLDILDYLEATEGRRVFLRLKRGSGEITFKARKEAGVPLGLVLDEAVFDGVRTCRNKCIFCFVDQMPRGLRPTLYVKDDDYRLSFYYGNFVTLNNLSGEDLERITRLRLSPLYVSLHSTDPDLRSRLMGGNAEAGLETLKILLDEGLEIHLQVVVCPGINDGEALRRTLGDVLEKYPAASLGTVPLGMTSRAPALDAGLKPHDRRSSREVLEIVEEYQGRAQKERGERVFFAADEFYLLAGREFPAGEEYEGYPQLENGVGMARKFIDDALEAAATVKAGACPGRGVITGVAGEAVIRKILEGTSMGETEVAVIKNRLFGESVTVAALLGGGDIIAGLKVSRVSARELLVPDTMLREGRFIDDLTLGDLEQETGAALIPVEVDGACLVRALSGCREEN